MDDSRERIRRFDPEAARRIETALRQGVHLHKVVSEDGHEMRPYCFSEEHVERALAELSDGLSRPCTQ